MVPPAVVQLLPYVVTVPIPVKGGPEQELCPLSMHPLRTVGTQ